jgi:hypothetical protein
MEDRKINAQPQVRERTISFHVFVINISVNRNPQVELVESRGHPLAFLSVASQRHHSPTGQDLMAHGGHRAEGRMPGIQQFLASGKILTLGAERTGGLSLLLWGQRFAHAEPAEGYAGSSHGCSEPL